MMVNDQLHQLYLEMELEGLSKALTLEEAFSSSSNSSDDNPNSNSNSTSQNRVSFFFMYIKNFFTVFFQLFSPRGDALTVLLWWFTKKMPPYHHRKHNYYIGKQDNDTQHKPQK